MKKIFLFCLIYPLIGVWGAIAQKKALLWEISGNGLEKPSYLYGTMHLICAKDFELSEALKQRFASAEQITLELDMDDPKMMTDMTQAMFMKNGMSLKKLLSETDYTALERYFKDSVGIGLGMLNNVKPFVLMTMMYKSVLSCPPESYEMTFVEMAKKQKKEVLGLESVKDQMAIFDEIPYEKQADAVMKIIREEAKADDEFAKMIALYKAKDIKKMAKLDSESEFEFKGFEDKLLTNRNANWIERMGALARQKSTFFAVGAAHLGGKKGVIMLLKKAGYQLTPIR
ncbi:MAG: TraB/GumN family protein [Spirosomataceae bacterium]